MVGGGEEDDDVVAVVFLLDFGLPRVRGVNVAPCSAGQLVRGGGGRSASTVRVMQPKNRTI